MLDTLHNICTLSKQAWFSGKPRWTPAQMPDLGGKVVIVTGSSSRIGKEIVRELLPYNAKAYLAARNPEKTGNFIEELTKATGKTAIFLSLNL
ncbi:uncharacterized protein EV420DRAFT_1539702 [Desarmillaria tabescens]|uniref:NAD(P)-binding protein n=1 Tax=Armillaria tabescens TaxID=1929756 RepID=A0AA39N5Z6_ARMTA|nr:uncharacterized protein EV420DRAFT_1539702 [Desarmillaria tabescens]KAK0459346.1 hypothetical protein EV420DRAFT_1539702 [Desarmillaria tabescens]